VSFYSARMRIFLLLSMLSLSPLVAAEEDFATDLNEQVVHVPLIISGTTEATLTATVYRPSGVGPFPIVVLSHGNPVNARDRFNIGRYRKRPQITVFVKRGFAVIVPIRRGFGATGGVFMEEYRSCHAPDYFFAGQQAARDLIATIEFARTLVFVDRERILLVGQSAGGFASLAASSESPSGLIGVVNFSGGRGGDPATHPGEPCRPDSMAQTIGKFARTIKVPVLWHYAENDLFFGPKHVRAWFHAFEGAGAKGRLVIHPPFGKDGHSLFGSDSGLPIWTAEFDKFLSEIGLNKR
jgi:dienelactone hydrolase